MEPFLTATLSADTYFPWHEFKPLGTINKALTNMSQFISPSIYVFLLLAFTKYLFTKYCLLCTFIECGSFYHCNTIELNHDYINIFYP